MSVPFVGRVAPTVIAEPTPYPEVKNGVWITQGKEEDGEGAPTLVKVSAPIMVTVPEVVPEVVPVVPEVVPVVPEVAPEVADSNVSIQPLVPPPIIIPSSSTEKKKKKRRA